MNNSVGNGSLASRLKLTRARRKLTQKQLANAADVSQQTVAAIEAGNVKQPHHQTITRISEVLKTSPAWLQFGIEELEDLDEHAMKLALMAMRLSEDQRKLMAMQVESFLGSDPEQEDRDDSDRT